MHPMYFISMRFLQSFIILLMMSEFSKFITSREVSNFHDIITNQIILIFVQFQYNMNRNKAENVFGFQFIFFRIQLIFALALIHNEINTLVYIMEMNETE